MQRSGRFMQMAPVFVLLWTIPVDAQLEPVVEEVCSTLGCDDFCSPPVPAGTIVMWSGSLDTIPPDWALCDGTNGTPDLRERFVMGVSDAGEPGETGGSVGHIHTSPAHVHGMSLTNHGHGVSANLSSNQAGDHVHTTSAASSSFNATSSGGIPAAAANHLHTMQSAGQHGHFFGLNTSTSTAGAQVPTDPAAALTDPADHLPPYYTLAFIMRLPANAAALDAGDAR